MPNCEDCEWARQVGDKTCTTVVGCSLLYVEEVHPNSVTGARYNGWMFTQRRPGETEDSKELGKGAMVYGPHLVSASAECPAYQERKNDPTR